MPTGNRSRRAAWGFALGVAVALSAGCRGPSAFRVAAPEPPRRPPTVAVSTPRPAPSTPAPAPAPPIEFAAIPPPPSPTPPGGESAPAPTPLLDAALKRAEALEQSVAEEVARPPQDVAPPAAEPARPEAKPDAPAPPPPAAPTVAPEAPADAPVPPAEPAPPATPRAEPRPAPPEPRPEPVAAEEPPLEIADLRPCRRVLGFGNVEPWGTPGIRPGQALILYCEMAGIRYEPDGDQFRSRLAATIALIPEGADDPAWTETLGTAEDACRHRRRDYYVNYRITLPGSLPPGPYRLRLTQADLISGRSTSRTIPLTVGP